MNTPKLNLSLAILKNILPEIDFLVITDVKFQCYATDRLPLSL